MSSETAIKSCIAVAGTYCGLGLTIPIFPTIISMFAVIMVRVLIWTKTKSITWNLAVCGLAMLAAFVTVEGSAMNSFRAFWWGVGYGGLGVGIIEIGKSNVVSALKAGFETMFKSLAGTNKDTTP